MKKFVAILLCVAMLMVGVVAQAENGYVTMKALFGDKDQLGTGTSKQLTRCLIKTCDYFRF